jgi:hypothetical protein
MDNIINKKDQTEERISEMEDMVESLLHTNDHEENYYT